jgi:hypothetical protein
VLDVDQVERSTSHYHSQDPVIPQLSQLHCPVGATGEDLEQRRKRDRAFVWRGMLFNVLPLTLKKSCSDKLISKKINYQSTCNIRGCWAGDSKQRNTKRTNHTQETIPNK